MRQRREHILAVEHPDVASLDRRDTPHGPDQLDMVRLINRMYFETPPPPATTPAVPAQLSALEREIVVMTVLSVQGAVPLFVAVHAYWALMLDAEPTRIAWIFGLIGVYAGIGVYTSRLKQFVDTLYTLKRCAKAPKPDAAYVVAELRKTFG